MLSSYRLGDLVLLGLTEDEKSELINENPNSIGTEYILSQKLSNNIDLITNIVLKHIEKNIHLLPKDIENCTVIHLRLGDVVSGNEWHEKLKRPISVNYLKKIAPNNKTYIIGKCFFCKSSSTNYDICTNNSNQYLKNVINNFDAEHFDGGNADIDLCCAVKSKYFIQGRGFFSKLIIEIRKNLNLLNIETSVHD